MTPETSEKKVAKIPKDFRPSAGEHVFENDTCPSCQSTYPKGEKCPDEKCTTNGYVPKG